MLFQPRAGAELVDQYERTAGMARARADHVFVWDAPESKQWEKVAKYCDMMAKARLIDAPDALVDYDTMTGEVAMDPASIQRRIAEDICRYHDDVIDYAEERDEKRPMSKPERMALAAAMRLLSPTERIIVQMVYGWALPKDLVAEVNGIEVNSVTRYLQRAQKKFEGVRQEMELGDIIPSHFCP